MPQPYKRRRIKTGKNSWMNMTIKPSGTTVSYSTKSGNTTYNVNPKRGNRMWTNNFGWITNTKTSNRKGKNYSGWFGKTKSKNSRSKAAHNEECYSSDFSMQVAFFILAVPLITIALSWFSVEFLYALGIALLCHIVFALCTAEPEDKLLMAFTPMLAFITPVAWVALLILYVVCSLVSP